MQSEVINNIHKLYEKYVDKIKSEKHLLLLYWKEVDGVHMDKEHINTVDFLNVVTNSEMVLDALRMYKTLKELGEWK